MFINNVLLKSYYKVLPKVFCSPKKFVLLTLFSAKFGRLHYIFISDNLTPNCNIKGLISRTEIINNNFAPLAVVVNNLVKCRYNDIYKL